jgi:hypothetical protein
VPTYLGKYLGRYVCICRDSEVALRDQDRGTRQYSARDVGMRTFFGALQVKFLRGSGEKVQVLRKASNFLWGDN